MKPFIPKAILMAVALTASSFVPAFAGTHYEEGVRFYNAGNFPYALVSLSQACGQNPRHVMSHYYLANTLVKQNMSDRAMAEYGTCYKLDPTSPVSKYCLQALERYRTVRGESMQRTLPSATIPGITDIQNTSSVIRRQAQYEKAKHHTIGESWAKSLNEQADHEARKLKNLADQEIERVLEPPRFFPGFGRPPVNSLGLTAEESKARAEEIRRHAEEGAQIAKMNASGKAQQYRSWSSQRQQALDDVVANLENQLREPTRSGVKLQPVGTDLYVRFYGYKRASAQLPDVRPATARFIDKDGLNLELEQAARAQQLRMPSNYDPRSVRGKVIER